MFDCIDGDFLILNVLAPLKLVCRGEFEIKWGEYFDKFAIISDNCDSLYKARFKNHPEPPSAAAVLTSTT